MNICNSHWTLVYIDRIKTEISYYDGYYRATGIFCGNQYTEALLNFFCDPKHVGYTQSSASDYRIVVPSFIIQNEEDDFSCGVILCLTADYLAHGQTVPNVELSTDILNEYRVKIFHVLHSEAATVTATINTKMVNGIDVTGEELTAGDEVTTATAAAKTKNTNETEPTVDICTGEEKQNKVEEDGQDNDTAAKEKKRKKKRKRKEEQEERNKRDTELNEKGVEEE